MRLRFSKPVACSESREHGWQSHPQMLIPAMSGDKQGMTFLIVQDNQSATSQDFGRRARSAHVGRAALAGTGRRLSINIENRNEVLSPLRPWFPELCAPTCERIGQERIGSNGGNLRQKSFGMAVAVGPMP
jgi:hypothetical protein